MQPFFAFSVYESWFNYKSLNRILQCFFHIVQYIDKILEKKNL